MPDTHLLSKSAFLRSIRCKKALYLDRYHGELRDLLKPEVQRRMQEGQQVGQLARGLFPGGQQARTAPFDVAGSLNRTRGLLAEGEEILYEAAILHDQTLAFVDLLVKEGGAWCLYEVKSTTQVKDHHLWDVALQVHLMEDQGLPVQAAYLVHLNRDYRRRGTLDPERLFVKEPILKEVRPLLPEIGPEISAAKVALRGEGIPDIDIGPYCLEPDECDFMGHCWKHVPEPSVFDIYYAGKEAFKLYQEGILRIEEVPEGRSLGTRSDFHIQAHKVGEPIIKSGPLQEFLQGLRYPLSYLDFETFATAIPPYDGIRPHGKVPFQYSVHRQESRGAGLSHSGYLAEVGTDPRPELLARFLQATDDQGDILVYHLPFEKGVLAELAIQYPEFEPGIQNRIDRLVDLKTPFQKRHVYLPEMGGSISLKSVLPAVVPGMDHESLDISEGTQAMEAYLGLFGETDPERVAQVRESLWEYCRLDTLAMVRILERLYQLAEEME